MRCTELHEDLEAVLDNAVDDTRMHSIELHLASCDSCRSRLDRLQSLRRVMCENDAINVPASLDERVLTSFNGRRGSRETRVSLLRSVFVPTLRIPTPIFGLFLLMSVSAVAISYWVGKRNATSIVVAAPAMPTQVESPILRATSVDNQVDPHKPDHRETAIATSKKKAASQSKRNSLPPQMRVNTQQLRSSTTINVNSATYSTVASLKGFEPLPTAIARIIKGGHDK